MEHEGDGDTTCNRCAQYSHQRIGKVTGRIVNKNTNGEHPNESIIKICQNTWKNPWDFSRLAATQTPVKNYQLMLVWKTLKGCPRGVMVKAMDCEIVVSQFVLQSRYYVHFRENTLGNGMKPLILPAMS